VSTPALRSRWDEPLRVMTSAWCTSTRVGPKQDSTVGPNGVVILTTGGDEVFRALLPARIIDAHEQAA
jgi:hypothetical protein